jgi:hypothetical protein
MELFMRLYKDNLYKYNDKDRNRYPNIPELSAPVDYQFFTFSGTFQFCIKPLRYLFKDLVDTFKPYKSNSHIKKDALKPIAGIKDIFIGLGAAVIYPLAVIFLPIVAILKALVLKDPRHVFTLFLSTLILGPLFIVGNLILGVTRIVTSPLLLLKIPFRLLITAFTDQPLIENNAGIKSLVRQAEINIQTNKSTALINRILALKCVKAINNGQATQNQELLQLKEDLLNPAAGRNVRVSYLSFLTPQAQPLRIDTSVDVTVCYEEGDSPSGHHYPPLANGQI